MICQEPWPTLAEMVALTDDDLSAVDPVVMNIVVAKGIPSLANLDVGRYIALADQWAGNLRRRMPMLEENFHKQPGKWNNDLAIFRLGLVCQFLDVAIGIGYREEFVNLKEHLYTNPSDLFLNGVMDTRRGTCASMAILNVVIGRRVGLPVFLATAASHFLCRYEDGAAVYNIESTDTGNGTFSAADDTLQMSYMNVPVIAQKCGSDFKSATPREMLGLFVGLRARHLDDIACVAEAEQDYLLARYLFPQNRYLYERQTAASVRCSLGRFDPHEQGHPIGLALASIRVAFRRVEGRTQSHFTNGEKQ